MEFIFQRGGEELTLEIQQEIATAELLVVWHQPDGTTKIERFGDHDGAVGYVRFLEERLLSERWARAESHQRPRGSIRAVYLPEDTPTEPLPTTLNGRLLTMKVTPAAPPETAAVVGAESEASNDPPGSPSDWKGTARYALERPVTCPHCQEQIQAIKVIRLVRSQVPFTSTLPRRGRVMTCPGCDTILSAEL